MTEKFSHYDTADYLKTDEDMALYFEACLEKNDSALIAHALGVIARARYDATGERHRHFKREPLQRALSADGNPEFATILKVTQALGINASCGNTLMAISG